MISLSSTSSPMQWKCFDGDCEITQCHNAQAVRNSCKKQQPDIALLDIEVNSENGISLARELFPNGCGTAVIFITGHMEYCTDVYEAEHIYFLLKPLKKEQLKKALTKAVNALEIAPSFFSVKANGTIHRIDFNQVMYIESFYRKIRIHHNDGLLETYGTLSSLPGWVQARMIRCHKSFLVNPNYIKSISGQAFLLRNGASVPISHSNRTSSRQQFLNHLACIKECPK